MLHFPEGFLFHWGFFCWSQTRIVACISIHSNIYFIEAYTDRITQSPGWKGPQETIESNSLLKQTSHNRLHRLVSARSWISPYKDTPPRLWATCSSALSPLPQRTSSACLYATSHVQVLGHCSLSYHYTPPIRAWPHPIASHLPLDIHKHLSDLPSVFFSPCWTDSGYSAFLIWGSSRPFII